MRRGNAVIEFRYAPNRDRMLECLPRSMIWRSTYEPSTAVPGNQFCRGDRPVGGNESAWSKSTRAGYVADDNFRCRVRDGRFIHLAMDVQAHGLKVDRCENY